jgi:integrase
MPKWLGISRSKALIRKQPDYHPETEFRIVPPQGRGKTFRIQHKSPSTRGKWVALKLEEIDAANRLLKDGVTSPALTKAKLKLVLEAQYQLRDRKKSKPAFSAENFKILEYMWVEKYNRRKLRTLKRPEDSRFELEKAIEACGMFPLDTCDLDQLADHLDNTLGKDQNKLNRRITWINSILQWLGRNKLQAVGRKRSTVKYLNEDEFKFILPKIPDPTTRRLATIAFYTGARLGEIFFIQPRHIRDRVLFLELQMTDTQLPDGSFKEQTLKSGYSREIYLDPRAKPDLIAWAKVPVEERYKIRKKSFCKQITRACEKAFGAAAAQKKLTFHDLRHCHAILLLQAGATITEVAQQLGNGPDVCYRYYSGFDLKKESVDRLSRLLGADK